MRPAESKSTRPSKTMRPRSGRSSPAIVRSVRLFPEPDGPKMASGAPAATIDTDRQALNADTRQFADVARDYGADAVADAG